MAGSRVADCVNAAVDTLRADVTLTGLLSTAKVYTHVPQGTTAPFVLVMGGDEIPWADSFAMPSDLSPGTTDGGDSGGRQVDVNVQVVSTYKGSTEVDSIADRLMEVLTDVDTWDQLSGWQMTAFVRNAAVPPVDLNSDGVLWFQRLVTVRVTLA